MKKTIIIISVALALIATIFLFYWFTDNSAMPYLNDNEEEVIYRSNLDNKPEKDSKNESEFSDNDTENSKSEEGYSGGSQEDENNNKSEANDEYDNSYDDSEEQTEE
jgi:uncharacterized protein YxeA